MKGLIYSLAPTNVGTLNTRTRLEARQDSENIMGYCKGYRRKNGSSDHDGTLGQNQEPCIRLVVKLDTFSL